jgi:hypothetical protein
MDTLTNEKNYFRSQEARHSNATTVAAQRRPERSPSDTSDNLDAIQEVDYQVDDSSLAPQVGAHGSYSFSMHVLTLPPICVLQRKRDPRIWLPVKMTVKLEVRIRTEARFRWTCRPTSYNSGSLLRRLRILELGSGYLRQGIPMVEKEGERCFFVDLWRKYVPFTCCAFAIIDHVLLSATGSGKTIPWHAVS